MDRSKLKNDQMEIQGIISHDEIISMRTDKFILLNKINFKLSLFTIIIMKSLSKVQEKQLLWHDINTGKYILIKEKEPKFI